MSGMDVEVALLPAYLKPHDLEGRTVIVFDVLRATTTMAAALASGVAEIRIFASLDEAATAAAAHGGRRILCGEQNCLPPPGFDLGNSPGGFRADVHAGHTAYMSTTNGTRAIVATREARTVFIGALVNASATARAAAAEGADVTLLCAGTGGEVAMEDVLGAGAVVDSVLRAGSEAKPSDAALLARRLFRCAQADLRGILADSRGGRNVIAAGLAEDIDFAARVDALDVVGLVAGVPLSVRRVAPGGGARGA